MSLLDRIKHLERREGAAQPDRIFVHYEGDDWGMCEGKRYTLAEWRELYPDSVIIHVGYDSPAPVPD